MGLTKEKGWVLVGDQIHDRKTKFNKNGSRLGETPNLIATVSAMPSEEQWKRIACLLTNAPETFAALKEARVMIESWAAFADDFFKEKYDLKGELARLDLVIAKAEGKNPFALTP